MNPFDYVKAINKGNRSFMNNEEAEKGYNAFIINRAFSLFPDSALDANIMNSSRHLPSKLQYDYYSHTLLPANRFSKWYKKNENREKDIQFLMEIFNYSRKKVLNSWEILAPQIEKLKDQFIDKNINHK